MAINTRHYLWQLCKSLLMAITVLNLVGLGWVISTESGLISLASVIDQQLPGSLVTRGLSGTLLTKIHAKKVYYNNPGIFEITLENIKLKPRLSQLFASRIAINSLNVEHVKLNLAKKSVTPPIPKPQLLPHIHIPSLHLEDLPQWDIQQSKIGTFDLQFADGSKQRFINTQVSSQLHRDTFAAHFETQNPDQHHFVANLDINGTPEKYSIKSQLSNDFIQLPLQGQGTQVSLMLALPNTQTPAGSLAVTLNYRNTPPSLKIDLHGSQMQLEKLSPDYHGNIEGEAHLHANNQLQVLDIPKLTGTYFGHPLNASVYTTMDNDGVGNVDSHISLGNDQIDIQFDRSKSWLEWSANIKQLATFFSNQSGRLITQGRFTPAAIHASATGLDLAIDQWHFNKCQLNLDGTLKQHQLKIQVISDDEHLTSDIKGTLKNDAWQGQISTLNLDSPQAGQWQLKSPANLDLKRNNLQIAPFCWHHEQESICGDIALSQATKTAQISLNAQAINLEPWSKMLLHNMSLKGTGSLQTKINISPSKKLGNIQANIIHGSLFDTSSNALSDHIDHGQFTAHLDDHGLKSELTVAFAKSTPLHAQWNMPKLHKNIPIADQPIQGHFTWETKALGSFNMFEFSHPSGKLSANMYAYGTLGSPKLNGHIQLKQGSWSIPWLNLVLQNANLDLNSQGDHTNIHGQVTSGKGTLHIDGAATLKNGSINSNMDLTGENITIENTPDLMLVATPKLVLTTADSSVRITGEAFIPEGEIRFQDFSNTVLLPEDATFTHEDYGSPTQATLSHHIDLTLGKDVTIKTYGIQGLLTGNLILHKVPYRNTMVDGQLHLKQGTYSTYGITLNIEQGMLNYTNNPFWSPWLSLTAIRDVKDDSSPQSNHQSVPKQVGISLEGPLTHLVTEYFSRPASVANQQQILSYLISGHSSGIDPSTVGRNALLFNTLQLYGLNKTSPLGYTLARIKDTLNLNELTLDLYTPTPFSTMSGHDDIYTSLLIGKQLSKRLYVKSNIGMPIGSLTLSYQLTKRWSIQASSSYGWSHESHPLETGADLFYNF